MTTLFGYLKQTQRLLREENQELVNPQDLIDYINIARGQVAGEGECIRSIGTISTVMGQRPYGFSSIGFGSSATTGINGALNVRRINYTSGSGQIWFASRPWEWFDLLCLNAASPASGPPSTWSQFGQGATGSFYLDPPPDAVYVLNCDCTCYPINLVDNTTVEAIPYLWTDAVAYFAAYLAFLELFQNDKAQKMFEYYTLFMQRARTFSNPSVNRAQYEQADDPVMLTKLGIQQRGAS